MAGVVDVPAGTRDRPTAIQGFQPIHAPGKISDDLARITDQNLSSMRLEQVVEPGCPSPFLEGHEQAAAQSSEELQKRRGLGFQDRFYGDFARGIHHRY
jgi:hypothetical protein